MYTFTNNCYNYYEDLLARWRGMDMPSFDILPVKPINSRNISGGLHTVPSQQALQKLVLMPVTFSF